MAVVLFKLHRQGRLHTIIMLVTRRAEDNGAQSKSVYDVEEDVGLHFTEAPMGTRNRLECDLVLLKIHEHEPRMPRLKFDAVGSRRVLQVLTGRDDQQSIRCDVTLLPSTNL